MINDDKVWRCDVCRNEKPCRIDVATLANLPRGEGCIKGLGINSFWVMDLNFQEAGKSIILTDQDMVRYHEIKIWEVFAVYSDLLEWEVYCKTNVPRKNDFLSLQLAQSIDGCDDAEECLYLLDERYYNVYRLPKHIQQYWRCD